MTTKTNEEVIKESEIDEALMNILTSDELDFDDDDDEDNFDDFDDDDLDEDNDLDFQDVDDEID
jgi:hypothetical protein